MTSVSRPLTLYTINMSHYSEKIRWLLDHEQIPYKEVPLTPAIHTLPMLAKGGFKETTVPVIQQGSESVQDSPRIVDWLTLNCGPLQTMPEAFQEEIITVKQRFDAIGKPVARFLYLPGFAHDGLIKDIWTQFATPLENRFVRLFYPVIKPVFKVKLKINPKDVVRAEEKIGAAIEWLNERLEGREYLVGEQFTVADITAASLLAPLACPPEHPIYGQAEFREKMSGPAQKWNDTPALNWVRKMYAQHRGPVWENLLKAS